MSILDFLYPKRCAGCGKAGTYFCAACIKAAKLHFPQVCPVCERASVDGVRHKRCREGYDADGLFVIWHYEGVPRKLIHKLKYKFTQDLSLSLASSVAGVLKNWKRGSPAASSWGEEKFVLVPIPLHWWRGNWRGFNQAEKVAAVLAELMGWQMLPILRRKKWTKTQVGLKAKERVDNIKDAFELDPEHSSPITLHTPLVLFDDVWTSGATMCEAARVLKREGFKKVWCLTLAR